LVWIYKDESRSEGSRRRSTISVQLSALGPFGFDVGRFGFRLSANRLGSANGSILIES
jgi:hypothetical protein